MEVVCFGALRDHLPQGTEGNRAEIALDDGATVAELVTLLGAPRRWVFAVLVDGRRAGLDHGLSEGAEVTLMPPFSGG
ncbi:MAG: MoaD/ThiS family protein [Actinomycetota bacterium]